MLNRIVQYSLRYAGVVAASAGLVLVYGVYVASRTTLDVFPEFAPPQVVVQTEAPGLLPEQVEMLVTRPIESGLNGAPQLEAIRSQSIQGLSVVTVVFSEEADIHQVRQMVSERLGEVGSELPEGVGPPRMGPLMSSTSLALAIGLTSTDRTAMDLRTFAEWTLRPRLLGVPGVAKVDLFGGEVRQLQVRVRPDRLAAYSLSLPEVLAAARQSTAVLGAGFVENANQRVVVRTEGQALTPEMVGETVVKLRPGGVNVRLRDVAEVVEGAEPKFGDAQIQGDAGVIVLVASQFGANTLEVTAAAERALAEMAPLLAAERIRVHERLFRPANFIEASLRNINKSLLIGGLLVAAVLYLFLLDLRTAFISFIAIPLSLLAAVIVLDWRGFSLNTITLGGFAIAIGVVVDDAIIDVENILRRLRENLALGRPRPFYEVVLEASLEVRGAVVYATLIVVLVFLPVFGLSGVQGRLFSPLALAFVLAILASLVVAMTVTPALCFLMLGKVGPRREPRYLEWLKARHRRWLDALGSHPRGVIGLVLVLCLGAGLTMPYFGGEFLPEFKEGHYILHMAAVPGTSLAESLRIGRQVTQELLRNPKIRSVSQQAGRAENGEDPWGPHLSEFHVDLHPMGGEETERMVGEIRAALLKFPGLSFKILPFLAERMEETLSGAQAEVVINLFGEDLGELDRTAAEVREVVEGVRGAVDVQAEAQLGTPELAVRLKLERVAECGFRPAEVLEAIETAYQGQVVAQVHEGSRVFDLVVTLAPASRSNPEEIGSLWLENGLGARFPLRELAELELSSGRYVVAHEGARRRQQVTCNVEGRDVVSFVAEVKRAMAEKVVFSPGIYPVFGGVAEAQARARRELLVHSGLAGVGVVLLLSLVFGRARLVLLVLANLPFALVGGVLAVFASGGLLSVGTLVGFVTLFGITMRNSIMMISHYQHLVVREGLVWDGETARRGALERLVPILMTALVTALGLLPLAIGSGEAGREIEGPMAIVILGGLVTSTALNLLILPTLALRYGRFGK